MWRVLAVATLGVASIIVSRGLFPGVSVVHAQKSLAEQLEDEAYEATLAAGSLAEQLETKGYLALHERKEEYPEPGEYEDIEETPIPTPVEPPSPPPTPDEPGTPAPPAEPDESDPVPGGQITPELVFSTVNRAAGSFRVDPNLVLAMIKVESNFDPSAVSPAGARGLMQLMPPTAREMGVEDPFDPVQNINGGTKYYAWMREMFGDQAIALAAYNAGPGNVKKHKGIPPFKETRDYIKRVAHFHVEFARNRPNIVIPRGRTLLASDLPSTRGTYYLVEFDNGFTQPAEVLVRSGDYYLSQYKGHAVRIARSSVKAIELMGDSAEN